MIFRHSAATALTRETVIEEADRLPVDIHPALVGTGRLGLALDATGMQGLNTWLGHYPDGYSLEHTTWVNEKHLHIYRDRALSLHYAPEPERDLGFNNPHKGAFSLLPLGWLEYEVEIDGARHELREGRAWRRAFTPRTGTLVTGFNLGPVRLEWTTAPVLDQPVAPFALRVESLDGAAHAVRVTVKVKLGLRDGRPLATGGLTAAGNSLVWEARDDTSAAPVFEPVRVRWTLAGKGETRAGREELALTLSVTTPGTAEFVLIVGTDYDGREWSPATVADGQDSWRRWFAEAMDVWLGDPEREYLQACAQYTLRAGAPWDHGCPLGTIWTQKFGGMTFWDTFFAVDGLLRAGHVEEARRFADWCVRTMKPKGRPHYWMTWYDGTPGSNPKTDQGYQSTLAFAQSLIRYAEVTGDRERVLPYLRRVAEFLLAEVLDCDEAGRWTMKGTVAHDICVDAHAATSQPVILAWAVSCVAKYAEYSGDATARRVAEFYRQATPKIDLTRGMWDEWSPNLTQSQPFADYAGWACWFVNKAATVPLHAHEIMPWHNVNQAVSCAVAGEPSIGLAYLDHAHDHVSGLGYLGESLWEYKCGGNTPYVPSSGAYLAAVAAMICDASIWPDAEVRVGPNIPERWRNHRFRWQNVVTLNGVRTSGRYEPTRLELELDARQPLHLRLSVPPRIEGSALAVTVDGKAVAVASGESVCLEIPAGKHTVTLARDETARPKILLIEPSVHGRELQRLLGPTAMRLCETASLPDWVGRAPVIVLPREYVTLRPDHVMALARAVETGARLVCLHHAACRALDRRLAELTGLNARHDRDYQYAGRPVELRLTALGRQALPGVPERFPTWITTNIYPEPGADVEVLATHADEKTAAVTRRRVGKGWVAWACMGEKLMDRDTPETCAVTGGKGFGYSDSGGAPFLVFGKYADELTQPRWLREPSFAALLRALTTADWR